MEIMSHTEQPAFVYSHNFFFDTSKVLFQKTALTCVCMQPNMLTKLSFVNKHKRNKKISFDYHGKNHKSLKVKYKRVLKGNKFPFIRRMTPQRPKKNLRFKLFFLSYMLWRILTYGLFRARPQNASRTRYRFYNTAWSVL